MTKADALAAAVQALESALSSSGQMCGDDAAGKAFGLSYRQGGQALFSAAEAAVNACRNVGYGIEVSASNYAHSEAASTVGGGEPSVPPPSKPSKFSGPTMPNPFGPAVGEPMLWAVVRQFVGSPWPDGNPATVRAAAAAWRSFGSAIAGVTGAIGSCSSELAGHDVPELASISNAVKQLSSGVQGLGTQSASIASSLNSFAGEVESSQQAIRDLLHRLSASGILQELGSIFSGHNPMDDIKQVANDIKEILHTLSREADGSSTLFQAAMNELDTLTTDLENWDRKEFTHFLGNPVGNLVADYVNADLDFTEGAGKSLLETVGSLGDLATHPQQLLDLLKQANPETQLENLVIDPKGVFDRNLNMVKGLVDAKDWSSDHPLRGLGNNVGNLAQILIPGAGEAKAGAEGARVADEAAQATSAESKAARAGDALLGGGVESDVAARGSRITHDLDGINAKPAEPTAAPAPIKPPESGPPVRQPDPGPVKTGDPGASGGAGAERAPVEAPPAPHTSDGIPAETGGQPAASSGGAHEPAPTAVAGGGAHEPVPVGSGSASAEHLPAPRSHVPESPPARVPVTPDGSPAEPTLASASSPKAAPMSPGYEPLPEPHPGGADTPGLPPDDPGGGGGHGDGGGGGGGHDDSDGGDDQNGDGSGSGSNSVASDHGAAGDGGPTDTSGSDLKLPGIHYAYSPSEALDLLKDPSTEIGRLLDGGVPRNILDGYDPLAGRTPEEFAHDFAIRGQNDHLRWDWDGQAPDKGFSGQPHLSDRIPEGQALDRLGSDAGAFMADEGAPLATRAMPPVNITH